MKTILLTLGAMLVMAGCAPDGDKRALREAWEAGSYKILTHNGRQVCVYSLGPGLTTVPLEMCDR